MDDNGVGLHVESESDPDAQGLGLVDFKSTKMIGSGSGDGVVGGVGVAALEAAGLLRVVCCGLRGLRSVWRGLAAGRALGVTVVQNSASELLAGGVMGSVDSTRMTGAGAGVAALV